MTSIVDPEIKRFIKGKSLEQRLALSTNILSRYPERVPIIIGRGELRNTPPISKYRFLVSRDLSFGEFIGKIRKNIPKLDPTAALFFFLSNNMLIPSSAVMSSLYEKHKSEDGFLYITYSAENTFG